MKSCIWIDVFLLAIILALGVMWYFDKDEIVIQYDQGSNIIDCINRGGEYTAYYRQPDSFYEDKEFCEIEERIYYPVLLPRANITSDKPNEST